MHPDTADVTAPRTRDEYDTLLEQLRWTHALLGILVELEGGVVQIPEDVVQNYDLTTQLQVTLDPQSAMYSIAIAEEGDVVSDVTA